MASIDQAYIDTFENNVRQLAQQSETKLRAYVTERATNGEHHNWDRLGLNTATRKALRGTGGRIAPTPVSDTTWSRRVSLADTWDAGESTEQEDPVQMLIDPNSNLTQSLGMAMKRAVDQIVIDASTGDALLADGSSSVFNTDAPGQLVGTGAETMSFDIVTQVQEIFLSNDIDLSVPKVFVVGPTQVRKLMQLTEQTSKDYVRAGLDQLSMYGIVPNWLGFTWIMSNLLNDKGSAGAEIQCLAMTQRAVGLQVNRDITARVQEDPSISFAWRLYTYMTMGAVRVEDEHIVEVHLLDSL